ncbi:MAG: nucleotidyltransferase family protein [Firmicutes bacterium]|nr:nucleotidyltransferase family protein [Bacillota bacterium]
MKIAAVICEFNPFHLGHAYLLDEARKRTECDLLVCVQSGNFVQRAEPAIADMHVRARAALLNGADAVIELPALYATACGERFSEGAVNILNSFADALVFGSESGDLAYLYSVARIQAHETESFKKALQEGLDAGKAYAAAYAHATALHLNGASAPELPNDLLAVEYLKQLIKTSSPVTPVAVQRKGAAFHDAAFSGAFSSAAALRESLRENNLSALRQAMPTSAFDAFFTKNKICIRTLKNNFDLLIVEALRNRDLSGLADAGQEGLTARLKKASARFIRLDGIIAAAKSKRYTHARIRRLCLQALLGITHYPDITDFNIPARLIGVKEAAKSAVLARLPQTVFVQNKDFLKVFKTCADAAYIRRVNQTAANCWPLLAQQDGAYYESLPLTVV